MLFKNGSLEVILLLHRWQILDLCCIMAVVFQSQIAGLVAGLLCTENSFP